MPSIYPSDIDNSGQKIYPSQNRTSIQYIHRLLGGKFACFSIFNNLMHFSNILEIYWSTKCPLPIELYIFLILLLTSQNFLVRFQIYDQKIWYNINTSNMEALQFPRGNVYQVVCAEGNQALAIQAHDPKDFKGSRIVGTAPNANDIYQLWMIEKVGHGEDEYELVNCASGNVWDEESGEVRLKPGKQSSDQLFKVQKAQNNTFWFLTSAKGSQAVAFEGILRHKKHDPNVLSQLFYIAPVNNSAALNESCILVNAQSGKAVDIPAGTFEHGERLIQYEKNKRFNQRWKWVKAGNGYVLQSVLNGQCLDIAQEKTASGSKVVQWDKTGASNQQWIPVASGNGVWKIKSVHAPGMYLSIKDDNVNDGGKLQISDQDSPSQYWRIEGFVPKV